MQGTNETVSELIGRGYRVNPVIVAGYIRNGTLIPPITIGGRRVWTEADVRRLRTTLELNGRGPRATA